MFKPLLHLMFTVAILLSASACQKPGNEGSKPEPSPLEKKFKVGMILPLSGGLAPYGEALRNGFELARESRPEKFQHIEFLYEDSKYEGKTAVSAYQKLLTRKNPQLFYTWGVAPNEALIPIMDKNKTPAIVETTIKEATVGKDFIIRAARTGEGIARAFHAEFLNIDADKVAIVATEITFCKDVIDHIVLNDTEKMVQKVEYFPADVQDFRSFITSLKEANFTTVAVYLVPEQICSFMRQAAALHYSPRFLGTEMFDSEELVKKCLEDVDEIGLTAMDVSDAFRRKYLERYQIDSYISHAGQAYDAANMIAQVVPNDQVLSKEEIIERFAAIKTFKGVVGEFGYTNTYGSHDFLMPIQVKKIKNGEILLIR